MKTKKITLLVIGCVLSVAAYAGISSINYDTGEVTCTNGGVHTLTVCNADGISRFGHDNCRREAAKVCN